MRSLQTRFTLAVMSGAAIFAIFSAALAYQIRFERAMVKSQANLNGLMLAVEKTAAIAAYTADNMLSKEVVDGLSRNPLAASVELFNAQGNLIASCAQPGHRPEVVSLRAMLVERALHSPFDAKETVGLVRIKTNMSELESIAREEAATVAALTAAQTLLVAFLLYWLATRMVSLPLVQVAKALRELKPGSGQRLVMPKGHQNDEIGALVDGGNVLLSANEVALQRERQLRSEIEKMEAQYRNLFDASSAGIFVLSDKGHFINGNPTALKLVGLKLEDVERIQGQDFIEQVFARPDRVREMIADAASRSDTVSADIELRDFGRGRRWVHCLISFQKASSPGLRANDGGSASLVEGVMYDITERKTDEQAARHEADHDSLTGLKNRASSDLDMDFMVVGAAQTTTPLSVLSIDLDGFKKVNDTLGHQAGDQVLIQCAKRMLGAVRRTSDLIARVGGDEFLVVLKNTAATDVSLAQVAQNLINEISRPIHLDTGQVVSVGASIGIACFPQHGLTRETLLKSADAAMYDAKRNGKNRYEISV